MTCPQKIWNYLTAVTMCIYGSGHGFLSPLHAKSRAKKANEKAGYNDKNNYLFLRRAGQASRLAGMH